jgi:hypothetical protein
MSTKYGTYYVFMLNYGYGYMEDYRKNFYSDIVKKNYL